MKIRNFNVLPLSLVSKDNKQKIRISCDTDRTVHLNLDVFCGDRVLFSDIPVALTGGKAVTSVMLPVQKKDIDTVWKLKTPDGKVLSSQRILWKKTREWTFYTMISSHTDIGLHNSQYIQRFNSEKFLDMAMDLCDETEKLSENDRYRYTIEGTWFWNNYGMDRGKKAAEDIVKNYIMPGKIGICCGVAGNHTQTYGLEEMCRSAYEKKRLFEEWGIESNTLSMIDNNGISMSVIQPYAQAGYKNLIFAPNQWNPLKSTVWEADTSRPPYSLCPNAGGGGSRVDVRYDSALPMVFYWEDEEKNRILVWASTMYSYGGAPFAMLPLKEFTPSVISEIEEKMAYQLPLMESKYPYDIWLLACYADDQAPDLNIQKTIQSWNEKWQWPKIRTLGNPDVPFDILREKFGDSIPILKGDITGGWYQHPLTAAELLSAKFEADRLLPTAEKWSVIASLTDKQYKYPSTDFRRAWDYLLFNDEHSYGTSGYSGRKVYETWMQHRDWIEKATRTAEKETEAALNFLASKIPAAENSTVFFNPTMQTRTELVKRGENYAYAVIPPMGYRTLTENEFKPLNPVSKISNKPPIIENDYYILKFKYNGSIASVYDKQLKKELLDISGSYGANELVYTSDNHKTFFLPDKAGFEIITDASGITVISKTSEAHLKAEIVQTVTLPYAEKHIDIDNRIYHAKDMVNNNRYYRYIYYAFPFMVENCRRFCHLNGAVAEYAKTVTGHGTDVYMAVNEWCCSENKDFGVALMMLDSQLTEFDHIHPDKTDFANAGTGSQIFSYLATDWLQMHTPGGSHIDYRFRYRITSYSGGYKRARIPQQAELFANPVTLKPISAGKGSLPAKSHSFLKTNTSLRLLTLKRADDGNGIIARFYGKDKPVKFDGFDAQRNTVDEKPWDGKQTNGFITYRLNADIPERPAEEYIPHRGVPAPIGSYYTGLITSPRAAAGENCGQLYLIWGQNMEKDLSHYKLYRSENSGFYINSETFVADVKPGKYRVGLYVDEGLKEHTPYYYRVCAVNKAGICGEMSEEFCGITKEAR